MKKGKITLIRCLDCDLIQVEDAKGAFDITNYDYYKARLLLTQKELYNPVTTKRYVNLLTRLTQYRKNNAILDIGCGEGHFLCMAKEMNWNVKGIELAEHAVKICQKFNLDVTCSEFLESDLPSDHYDVVMMSEVLEHITRPKEYLVEVNRVLRTGGILIMTTPNFNCITRILLQAKWSLIHNEHLFYFTPASIKKMVSDTLFRILEFRITHINLPELYNFVVNKKSGRIFDSNQALRETIEKNIASAILKNIADEFLNITGFGESMRCVCQKP
ncbi:MAG: class I SAM-dependent methyltransferase [Candidatus Omnitrophica bacterium]|nr:class I SAM-dependent methyltransferase [Candidatus Omnitrophota bacterium]